MDLHDKKRALVHELKSADLAHKSALETARKASERRNRILDKFLRAGISEFTMRGARYVHTEATGWQEQ